MFKKFLGYFAFIIFLCFLFINILDYTTETSSSTTHILLIIISISLVLFFIVLLVIMSKTKSHDNIWKNITIILLTINAFFWLFQIGDQMAGGVPEKINNTVYILRNHSEIKYITYKEYLSYTRIEIHSFTSIIMFMFWTAFAILTKPEIKKSKMKSQARIVKH